jgi:hypothetical protein
MNAAGEWVLYRHGSGGVPMCSYGGRHGYRYSYSACGYRVKVFLASTSQKNSLRYLEKMQILAPTLENKTTAFLKVYPR